MNWFDAGEAQLHWREDGDPNGVPVVFSNSLGTDLRLIAQGMAVKRLDLVRGIVLSNTGAKIGNADMWNERIDAVKAGGVEAVADATMGRWFSKGFQDTPELQMWRNGN